jgi:hypothetical protein
VRGPGGLTRLEELKLERMAVRLRFPIRDEERANIVENALSDLESCDTRIRSKARQHLLQMEAMNQKDELMKKHVPTADQIMGKPLDAKDWIEAMAGTLPVLTLEKTDDRSGLT